MCYFPFFFKRIHNPKNGSRIEKKRMNNQKYKRMIALRTQPKRVLYFTFFRTDIVAGFFVVIAPENFNYSDERNQRKIPMESLTHHNFSWRFHFKLHKNFVLWIFSRIWLKEHLDLLLMQLWIPAFMQNINFIYKSISIWHISLKIPK